METINSMASTAAKAIWGDNNNNNENNTTTTTTTANENVKPGTETMNNETKGTEPVSGKLGNTSAGEPFDAGNIGMHPQLTFPTPLPHPPTNSIHEMRPELD